MFRFLPAFLFLTLLSGAQPVRLNNLVRELARGSGEVAFENPREGWIHIAAAPGARLMLDGKQAPVTAAGESMQRLTPGRHTVKAAGAIRVHAIPETQFIRYPQEPAFPALGKFSWQWLKANVLSSVNTLATAAPPGVDAELAEWTASGRRLISYGSLPHDRGLTGPAAFEYWWRNRGFEDPRFSGLIADEFGGRQNPLYPAWIDGMRRLGEQAKGTGKVFYAYTGGPGMFSRPEARQLVRTVIDSGFYMAWERYHHEMPTEAEGRALMERLLGREIVQWKRAFPDLLPHLVMVLGTFMSGPELNVQPDVNYKVWMDMQMQYLATHPEFDGLYGVQWWYSGAATEEILRWESALYRHYCIEGRTDLLSRQYGWTYSLGHVTNPDFVDGLRGWTAEPATEGSIEPGYLERYAIVQNRYWQRGVEPDEPSGNAYLRTRRQAARPNRVTQTLAHLEPGKLYTVELITADYQDIKAGRSAQKPHAVSIQVEGATVVPEHSYRSVPVRGNFQHPQLPFPNGPAYTNHHRVAFRAGKAPVRLVLSDWASATEPGGEAGQELMWNYVQVEPYYEVRYDHGNQELHAY